MDFVASLCRLPREEMLFGSSIALACVVGILMGCIWSAFMHAALHPPVLVSGSGAGVATVVLEGFRDGALRGHAAGPLRLFTEDETVEIAPDGTFAVVHPAFRIEEVSIPVPSGMQFVASKKGKKYYSVTSAGGERIAPENRVYFPNEADAEAAGFVR